MVLSSRREGIKCKSEIIFREDFIPRDFATKEVIHEDLAQMIVLGVSAFYHDSAAALVRDGEIVAAAQEERFTRKKHDAAFPAQAVAYCLDAGGITTSDLDFAAFY